MKVLPLPEYLSRIIAVVILKNGGTFHLKSAVLAWFTRPPESHNDRYSDDLR